MMNGRSDLMAQKNTKKKKTMKKKKDSAKRVNNSNFIELRIRA